MIWFWFMVFNATFNSISAISWRLVLLVDETGVPGENHRPVASHWKTLSHNDVLNTTGHDLSQVTEKLYHIMLYRANFVWEAFELTTLVVIGIDCIGSCKSNLPYDHDHDRPRIFLRKTLLFKTAIYTIIFFGLIVYII